MSIPSHYNGKNIARGKIAQARQKKRKKLCKKLSLLFYGCNYAYLFRVCKQDGAVCGTPLNYFLFVIVSLFIYSHPGRLVAMKIRQLQVQVFR